MRLRLYPEGNLQTIDSQKYDVTLSARNQEKPERALRSCFEIDEIIVYVLKILTHLPFGIFALRGRGKNYPADSGL
jgi:hypothetical protein